MPKLKRVSIIGLGYIGLPTAAMFASKGISVIGVDINANVVDTINRGEIHIVEPDLDIAVRQAVQDGYLRATTSPEPADAFLIAVPTPFTIADKKPNIDYVKSACISIAPVLKVGDLVVLESTSPVGTTKKIAHWLAELRPDLKFPQDAGEASDIRIAYCPERVLPGMVMQELITNDRVIGGMTLLCSEEAKSLYNVFVEGKCIVASNPDTAEMTKLTENSFRDVNIAFANELSILCDKLSINVWELISLANLHPRVNILQPGPGVGGHCIAVDPWFIVASAPEEAHLIRTAREVNDSKPGWVLAQVDDAIADLRIGGKSRSDIAIACYGLSFKPNIDDLRDSPALRIALELSRSGLGKLWVVEPHISHLPAALKDGVLVDFAQAADADIHLLLVDHKQFREERPAQGRIIDTKGVWL